MYDGICLIQGDQRRSMTLKSSPALHEATFKCLGKAVRQVELFRRVPFESGVIQTYEDIRQCIGDRRCRIHVVVPCLA